MIARVNLIDHPHNIIFLVGMPISGSTWMKNLLAQVPGFYTRKNVMPYKIKHYQDICDSGFLYHPQYGYSLFKTHLNPKDENIACLYRNGVDKIIVMYRDLRDVAVSRYYRCVDVPKDKTDPEYVDYNAISKYEGMNDSIHVVGTIYIDWIKKWLDEAERNPEKYFLVSYEELKKDTKKVYQEILDFYCIKMSDVKIDETIAKTKGKGNFKKNWEAQKILPLCRC